MRLSFFLPLWLLAVSCGNYEEFKNKDIEGFSGATQLSAVNFSQIKSRIMEPHCMGCHKGYGNYHEVVKDLDRIVSTVRTDQMPKNRSALSVELKSLLFSWAKSGAPAGQIAVEPTPAPIELAPNWESIAHHILGPKCMNCHGPDGRVYHLPLVDRNEIFSQQEKLFDFDRPENSLFIKVLTGEERLMPPARTGLERLTEEEIEVVKEWIRLGLPN